MVRSDHVLGGLAVIASLLLFLASFSIPTSPFISTLSSRFFPRVLACVFLALGLFLMVRPRTTPLLVALGPLATLHFTLFAGATTLYLIAFPLVDFRLGTALFLMASMAIMGARNPLELLLVPLFGALGMWAVFRFGFTILLPVWL